MSFRDQVNTSFLIFVIFSSFLYPVLQSDGNLEALPYCGQKGESEQHERLVIVSTLDGKISALNVDNGGTEKWSVRTAPGSMLSSSIHTLDLTEQGHLVRMIPSLSGGLYKFNGEQIEPIPITADHLLHSSFKFSDDLIISGGKESRRYGVELESGRVVYECSLSGCENLTELEPGGDVVLVQRHTQTVRAIEPRTGVERWNFSVSQHKVEVSPGQWSGCHLDIDPPSDIQLKVIVPEGLVCAISKTQGTVLWTHKFDAPVVSAWMVSQGQVQDIDLFDGIQPPVGPGEDPRPSSPLLYVGMHHHQLYIQESVRMQQKILQLVSSFKHHLVSDQRRYLQIPWKPLHISSKSISPNAVGLPSTEPYTLTTDLTTEDSNETTAMSVLYSSEYVNGNGFYLPYKEPADTLCPANTTRNNSTKEEVTVMPSPDDVTFTVSLWFWWKEVFIISVTTAVLVNLLIQRRIGHSLTFPRNQIVLVHETLRSYSSRDSGRETNSSSSTSASLRSTESFESRFLTDFIPVHCLGKGGFGVVFEAKNKIDDCNYAIKRIPLPNSEESRERVMREVKALAKLDHHNIVRYFNAWLECPPPGWQETQDQIWHNTRDAASSNGDVFTVDLTGQVTPESERSSGHVIHRLQPWTNWKAPEESEGSELPPIPVPQSIDNDNDSFIIFGSSSRDVSVIESENSEAVEEVKVNDKEKLDSAIIVPSDTSCDTNTETTDVERTSSPKRPSSLILKRSPDLTTLGAFNSSRMYLFIQMQLCKKKSLKDWLKDNVHNRNRPDVVNIFDQIVQAVEYVHMHGLIHRDLKPSNIFFSPDGQVKVGDFGLVTAMAESPMDIWVSVEAELDNWGDEKHTARVGTQLYMSPEQVSGKAYGYKVDIYSLGVILFELLVPFNTQMERIHTLTNLRANKFPEDFQLKFSQEFELLRLMLSHRPDERPTTFGIRARPPLNCDSPLHPSSEWHFELPNRRRLSTSVSKSSSRSSSLGS